ncbi:hypothetical protein ACGF5C_26040 [Micromonospora sp. NPDC047620]|uniref:hypothetical protein n=1 Tax=Micromonospora sp. NPDC047620 TaxID=3364251 RepID=UPI00371F7A99
MSTSTAAGAAPAAVGMVQRCADALAGSGAAVAILPAGPANLGIPEDLSEAVRIGVAARAAPWTSAGSTANTSP